MKKSPRYTLLLLVVATATGIYLGCRQQPDRQQAEAEGDTLTSRHFSISLPLRLDSILKQIEEDRQKELDYYLDRHNVEDEGYEMVAAFAAGQRHNEVIDTIPIYNIGRWKGKKRQGTAISRDSLGRITIGQWDEDTLTSGIRIDSTGIYQGAFRGGRVGTIVDADSPVAVGCDLNVLYTGLTWKPKLIFGKGDFLFLASYQTECYKDKQQDPRKTDFFFHIGFF